MDDSGTYHDSGWPECLEPPRSSDVRTSRKEVTFRFASVHADTEYVSWRPVVLVEC
ncbi:hypothetical protein [Nocardioides mangrovi]|uniref:Uncharacterized protein n=1 Tax=Nocardioides mangrovi TaxID=2874580 RepID=A0ABS7U8V4_9ACTN|nr:hypothetical protein [Nocardioides mangrovi]MBZ5737410.1 hypothetical protein [Nocardioides mangrovi]